MSMIVDGFTSRCNGTTVRLPSECLKKTWLPRCRDGMNPIFESALIISLPERIGSFSDKDLYQLPTLFLSDFAVIFKNQLDGFPNIVQGFLNSLTLAYCFWQFNASCCIPTRGFILLNSHGEHALLSQILSLAQPLIYLDLSFKAILSIMQETNLGQSYLGGSPRGACDKRTAARDIGEGLKENWLPIHL